MRKAHFPLSVLGASLLWACQFTLGGGSGSSSETESSIAGELRHADNRPAASARVTLTAGTHLQDNSAAGIHPVETVTDAAGRFSFLYVQSGYYALETRMVSGDTVLGSRVRVDMEGKPGNLRLDPLALMPCSTSTGILASPRGPAQAALFLYGSSRTALADSLGRFTLENLPPGLQLLRIVPEDASLGSLELAFRPGRQLGTLDLQAADVLRVADFEDGTKETVFSAAFPNGTWYVRDDGDAAAPTYRPADMRGDFTLAYADSGAWKGKSLHVDFRLEGNPAATYGSAAFSMGKTQPGYDFTALDSVVFLSKGKGKVRIEFQTRTVIDKYRDWRHFSKDIELPAEWTRFSIPIAEMALAAGSPALKDGLTWAAAGKQVANIVIIADDPADFWLDDLEFHGMSIRGM